jgi:hypothetical protein
MMEDVASAFVALQACAHPVHALYSAQLLHALESPAFTLRQLHRTVATGTSKAARNDAELAIQVQSVFFCVLHRRAAIAAQKLLKGTLNLPTGCMQLCPCDCWAV